MLEIDAPTTVKLSENCKAHVSFSWNMSTIEPGKIYQRITTCIVRLAKGPKTTYAGVAVCAVGDRNDEHTAEVVSLTRALAQVFPDMPQRELKRMARYALRDIAEMQAPIPF